MVFILVMVLYPDVMKRAQSEIDAVVGHDRMPAFSDMDQLPYITALVREVMRWKPVTPLALPKNCMEVRLATQIATMVGRCRFILS